MVNIILVSHGNLASSLLETASDICCFDRKYVYALSVKDGGIEVISKRIVALAKQGEVLVLADTFGGSCCNTALSCSNGLNNVRVVCGVNLNMLLAVLNNMQRLSLKELSQKAVDDGKKAVFNATEIVKQ